MFKWITKIIDKMFPKYSVYSIYGGTAFVPVYKHSENKKHTIYYGIDHTVPDLENLALTSSKFNKKDMAKKTYGYYMGADVDITNEVILSCKVDSLQQALDAIELHKEFVHFKDAYNEIRRVSYK